MPEQLYRPVTIGNRVIGGNLFLAPLAGFTDMAFRTVCFSFGADAAFSEMVSGEGLVRDSAKTADLLERGPEEQVFAVQLFMNSADTALRALPHVLRARPDLIDINCGCPVPKVVKTGAGSALLKSPETIYRIVSALTSASDIPVTVKIRSGWDSSSINYRETADAACSAGAAMITLHARTRAQGYSGRADYAHIADLKQRLTVPLFGSGDLFTPEDALRMLSETGADGVMFARGAIGNPFIFRAARHLLQTGEPAEPVLKRERAEVFLKHLDLSSAARGELQACREMRKHAGAYTRGFPGSAAVRRDLVRASSRADYVAILSAWAESQHLNRNHQAY
jgi:tRNA-dihydrouridine synthase B